MKNYLEHIKRAAILAKKWIKIRGRKKADHILKMFGLNHAQYQKYAGGHVLKGLSHLVEYDKEVRELSNKELKRKYGLSTTQILNMFQERIKHISTKEKNSGRPKGTKGIKHTKRRKLEVKPRKSYKKREKLSMREPQKKVYTNTKTLKSLDKIKLKVSRKLDEECSRKDILEAAIEFINHVGEKKFIDFLKRGDK